MPTNPRPSILTDSTQQQELTPAASQLSAGHGGKDGHHLDLLKCAGAATFSASSSSSSSSAEVAVGGGAGGGASVGGGGGGGETAYERNGKFKSRQLHGE